MCPFCRNLHVYIKISVSAIEQTAKYSFLTIKNFIRDNLFGLITVLLDNNDIIAS